jgi:gliding motility-associated-like protein
VWSRIIAGDTLLNLAAIPSNGYYFFDHWEKYTVGNSFSPDDTTDAVTFNFKKKDSVVAFFKYLNLDSIFVTFEQPIGKGTIALNNATISNYPYTIKLDRRFTYALSATPTSGDYTFFSWRKKRSTSSFAPSHMVDNVTYDFDEADTVTAIFQYVPPVPELPDNPPLPSLDEELIVPTAFSPNGDGLNDVFRIVKGKNVKSLELRIFDRWGGQVYSTNSTKAGWDGRVKGEPAEMGTYYYVLTAWFDNIYQNSSRMYKGEITLIR